MRTNIERVGCEVPDVRTQLWKGKCSSRILWKSQFRKICSLKSPKHMASAIFWKSKLLEIHSDDECFSSTASFNVTSRGPRDFEVDPPARHCRCVSCNWVDVTGNPTSLAPCFLAWRVTWRLKEGYFFHIQKAWTWPNASISSALHLMFCFMKHPSLTGPEPRIAQERLCSLLKLDWLMINHQMSGATLYYTSLVGVVGWSQSNQLYIYIYIYMSKYFNIILCSSLYV